MSFSHVVKYSTTASTSSIKTSLTSSISLSFEVLITQIGKYFTIFLPSIYSPKPKPPTAFRSESKRPGPSTSNSRSKYFPDFKSISWISVLGNLVSGQKGRSQKKGRAEGVGITKLGCLEKKEGNLWHFGCVFVSFPFFCGVVVWEVVILLFVFVVCVLWDVFPEEENHYWFNVWGAHSVSYIHSVLWGSTSARPLSNPRRGDSTRIKLKGSTSSKAKATLSPYLHNHQTKPQGLTTASE